MVDFVNGKTKVYGLIGNPVEHSLSPLIHNTLAQKTNINSVYTAYPVYNNLENALLGAHALSIKGLNVTVPYKKDVIPLLSQVDFKAEQIGAVNTLKYSENGYIGYNTDVFGIIKTLESLRVNFSNQSLLLLGAGGGAYSAAFGAAMMGAKKIFIANRSINNALPLASRLKTYYNIEVNAINYSDISKIDTNYFIIQATSAGMSESGAPVDDISFIKNASGFFDIVYTPLQTKMLSYAKMCGLPCANGILMLTAQAVKAFEIWNDATVSDSATKELQSIAEQFLESVKY